MDYSIAADLLITIDNLFEDVDGLGFGQAASFQSDGAAEITSVAELSDDVGIVFGGEYVKDFDDIGGPLEGFEHIDLGVEQSLVDISLEEPHVDHFDGHFFIWVKNAEPVVSFLPLKTWLEYPFPILWFRQYE